VRWGRDESNLDCPSLPCSTVQYRLCSEGMQVDAGEGYDGDLIRTCVLSFSFPDNVNVKFVEPSIVSLSCLLRSWTQLEVNPR